MKGFAEIVSFMNNKAEKYKNFMLDRRPGQMPIIIFDDGQKTVDIAQFTSAQIETLLQENLKPV